MENGRVARMLIKLGFINERPEYVWKAEYQTSCVD